MTANLPFLLPRVYPLTDTNISGLSHAEQVRRLAAGGATIIQLREKMMSSGDLYLEATATLAAAREAGVQLIINDRVDIALAVGADGVHLGQDDLPVEDARRLLGPGAIIGLSTHNLYQAKQALHCPVDYVAIGPIFTTLTKQDTEPELGLDGLEQVAQVIDSLPLVAIGGISPKNAAKVLAAGATSVAVVSALLSSPNSISARTAELFRQLN